jgi:hypothetical protein
MITMREVQSGDIHSIVDQATQTLDRPTSWTKSADHLCLLLSSLGSTDMINTRVEEVRGGEGEMRGGWG